MVDEDNDGKEGIGIYPLGMVSKPGVAGVQHQCGDRQQTQSL